LNSSNRISLTAFILCFVLSLGNLSEARFSYMNQENHAELHWKTLESAHFRLHYHQGLEEMAKVALSVSEQIYEPVCQQLDHYPKNKTDLAITDQDEIVNGFAMPDGTICIWVNQNDYISNLAVGTSWLREVIAHEFQHIVTFSVLKSWPGFMGRLISGTPAWWMEGLAEYYTEHWSITRSDRKIRMETLDRRLKTSDPHDDGYAKVLFLADQYGDSTLVNICKWRSKTLKLHSFDEAFKEATGKSVSAFDEEWTRVMNAYYNAELAVRERPQDIGTRFDLPLLKEYWISLLADSSAWVATGINGKRERELSLYRISADSTKKIEVLAEGRIAAAAAVSPGGDTIVFSRRQRTKYGSIAHDLYMYDMATDKEQRITQNERASQPDIDASGRIVYISTAKGSTSLMLRETDGTKRILLNEGLFFEMLRPRFSPSGKQVLFTFQDKQGNMDLAILQIDNSSWRRLSESVEVETEAVWLSEETLAFVSYRDAVSNIFFYDINSAQEARISDSGEGLRLIESYNQDSSTLIAFALDSAKVNRPMFVDPDRRAVHQSLQLNPYFIDWRTQMPEIEVSESDLGQDVEIIADYKYEPFKLKSMVEMLLPTGDGVFSSIALADPLGKNTIFGSVYGHFSRPADYSFASLTWFNGQLPLSISTTLNWNCDLNFRIYDGELLTEIANSASVVANNNFYLPRFPRATAWYNFGFGIWDSEVRDYKNENSDLQMPVNAKTGVFGLGFGLKWAPVERGAMFWPTKGDGVRAQVLLARPGIYGEQNYEFIQFDAYRLQPTPLSAFKLYARLHAENLSGHKYPGHRFVGYTGDATLEALSALKANLSPYNLGTPVFLRGLDRVVTGDQLMQLSTEFKMQLGNPDLFNVLGFSHGEIALAWFWDLARVKTKGAIDLDEDLATCGLELQSEVRIGGATAMILAGGLAGETWGFARDLEQDFNSDSADDDLLNNNHWYWRLVISRPF
jgi:hypothetical protein